MCVCVGGLQIFQQILLPTFRRAEQTDCSNRSSRRRMERGLVRPKRTCLKFHKPHTHMHTHTQVFVMSVCVCVRACVFAYPLWIKSACLWQATRSTVGRSMSTRVRKREREQARQRQREGEKARRLSADDELTASGHNGRLVRLRVAACEFTSTNSCVCVCVCL